jgi:hypothetical protein
MFSTKGITWFNRFTYSVHLILFIVALIGRYNGSSSPQIYKLKYDKVHLVGTSKKPVNVSGVMMKPAPFLQIASPYYDGSTFSSLNKTSGKPVPSKSLYETCDAAPPNMLDFTGSENFAVEMWTYPKNSGISIDLGWCVAAFFMLSFLFQAGLEVISLSNNFRALRYSEMFDNQNPSDSQHQAEMEAALNGNDPVKFAILLAVELHCNWWRFVEYTFSGSLVLVTIALLAGIVDVEVLVCIFFLAATCMLAGLVAEFALRARNALKNVEVFMEKMCMPKMGNTENPYSKITPILDDIAEKMSMCFRVSHFVGWVGIIVSWGVIIGHYDAWWRSCEADSLSLSDALINIALGRNATAAVDGNAQNVQDARRRTPPDFVRVRLHVTA